MALRYGFFDSEITGYDEEGMPQFDRAESSDFLAMFLSCLIRSGVLAVPGDCFQVLAGEGMAVRIRPGFGVVEGRLAYDDEESSMALEAADTQNRRIDRVILRANYPDRKCEILIRAGTPATDPQPPTLVRDGADYFELCLAEVAVRANQTVITQADITDTRADTDVCGWVTQNIDRAIVVEQAVIEASGWVGKDSPYENTIPVPGATATNIVEVTLATRPTEEQVTACADAVLVDGGQDEGSITIMAMGRKPEIDLPVTVIIR